MNVVDTGEPPRPETVLIHSSIIAPGSEAVQGTEFGQLRGRLCLDELRQIHPLPLLGRQKRVARTSTEVLDDYAKSLSV